MIIKLIAFILLSLTAPSTDSIRGLPPGKEHVPAIRTVYLPIVSAQAEVSTATKSIDRSLYGFGSPHRRSYSVPFYDWRAHDPLCAFENYWPMVRDSQQIQSLPSHEKCDNGRRWLLLYNEPELDHFSATPKEAVALVREWSIKWSGPLACCGNFYHISGGRDGLKWFKAFVAEYVVRYDELPPIGAISIHIYAFREIEVERLREWRALSEQYGWPIFVTEAGIFPSTEYTPEEIAEALPKFLSGITAELGATLYILMWFSDYLQEWVLGRDTAWHHLNLTNVDGSLTVVGAAWEQYTGTRYLSERFVESKIRSRIK